MTKKKKKRKPLAIKDEDSIPPKPSGYNLDFLDNLDDPTNAVPPKSSSPPIPKASGYNLDFLDNLDDPLNAAPPVFQKSNKMASSPPKENIAPPVPNESKDDDDEEVTKEMQVKEPLENLDDGADISIGLKDDSTLRSLEDDGDSGIISHGPTSPEAEEPISIQSPSPADLPSLERIPSAKLGTPDFECDEKWLHELDQGCDDIIFVDQSPEAEMEALKRQKEQLNDDQVGMMQVVGQYEKTISELISERERRKIWMEIESETLKKSKDEAVEDLHLAETAFQNVNR